ncbi:hypothetical protein COL922a_003655 [Colletotrichum nupharicola]|nr:hypothetical protein COL922a_003655 [Colletotrichum nupharicola]
MLSDIQAASPRLSPFILWPTVVVSLALIYALLSAMYNLTLHPLAKHPDPKLWAASRLPYSLMLLRGKLEENAKLPDFIDERHADLISANREDHARYRRILSHGFSAKSMQDQQPIIKPYIDLLIERLHSIAGHTTSPLLISSATWPSANYHPWVRLIFDDIKVGIYFFVFKSYKLVEPLPKMFVPKSLLDKRVAHYQLIEEKLDRRIAMGTPRPDFAQSMLNKTGDEALTRTELIMHSRLLIIAGSETTATALSGATYLLCSNPSTLAKLNQEVRSAFASEDEDEIDIISTAKLDYLQAVLEEALRMYPPVPSALPRVTPPGGQEILGQWIPENGVGILRVKDSDMKEQTTLDIWHWAMYHNEKNFRKPFEFHPGRWMGDPELANDSLDALKPFHIGPRNCLGINLAYAEMRMILARVIYNFDLQLAEESRDWLRCDQHQVHILWNKPPLKVHMTPRKRE